MELSWNQLQTLVRGASRIEKEADGVHFYRFSAAETRAYENSPFYPKTFSTAGVRLVFRTDSETLFLRFLMKEGGSSRHFFAVDVRANGALVGSLSNFDFDAMASNPYAGTYPLGVFEGHFFLGHGEKTVQIDLPWSITAILQTISLSDGALVSPLLPRTRALFFGDSITHGYDALHPSRSYASRVADLLDADARNKAIGGEVFFPPLADAGDDFSPELLFVAYGTNDWDRRTFSDFARDCRAFYAALAARYDTAHIFALTPIYRADGDRSTALGALSAVAETIGELAAQNRHITLVDGLTLLPHDARLFRDGAVHPTDEGFALYAEALYAAVCHAQKAAGGIF